MSAGTQTGSLERSTKALYNRLVAERTARSLVPAELASAQAGDRIEWLDGAGEYHDRVFAAHAFVGYTTSARPVVRFADGTWTPCSEMQEIVHTAKPAAALPECSTFAGAGQRCETCRVRRAMHA